MKAKKIFSAPMVALLVTACGGGGGEEAPSSTGSSAQTQFTVAPEIASSWVQTAVKTSLEMAVYSRYFELFAPAAPVTTGTRSIAIKDIGVAPCTYVSTNPNCSGTLRVETEFPVNSDQTTFRNGSKMSFQWQDITGVGSSTFNLIDTLSFLTDFPSAPPITGKFSSQLTQSTPAPLSTNVSYNMANFSVSVDPTTRKGEMSGLVKINSTTAQLPSSDESLTFTNWSNFQASQQASASVRMVSSSYLSPSILTIGQSVTVDITIISSALGRTEYRVLAKADGIPNSVTRTVLLTVDGQGNPVYTAS